MVLLPATRSTRGDDAVDASRAPPRLDMSRVPLLVSWRIRHLTSDGEKGVVGIASRYACLVCGCAVAARVLAPLRLDEELWWFYALVCGGVLFGPLLRVLPESWHGEASPWQLAVARVVFMVLFLQHELRSDHARPVAPGRFHNIKTVCLCGPAPSAGTQSGCTSPRSSTRH